MSGSFIHLGLKRNPLSSYLETLLNEDKQLVTLLSHVLRTSSSIQFIQGIIEGKDPRVNILPSDWILLPRSSSQIRLLFRNVFGVDIRYLDMDRILIEGISKNIPGNFISFL